MESSRPIYLDYAATTPVDPEVVAAMLPMFSKEFGNPSSKDHVYGMKAMEAVERARDQVAAIVNANPTDVVFTSGGTESNNLAIKGVMDQEGGSHLVVSAVEHASILDSAKQLELEGHPVTHVQPDSHGRIHPDAIEAAITGNTRLISVMLANNELGTINDIEAIAQMCNKRGVLVHTDAAQAVGKIPVDASMVDLLTFTGHKIYGPKGVGALIVKKGVQLNSQILGGVGERGRRAGTMNAASIVGFGKACELCNEAEHQNLAELRDQLERLLMTGPSGAGTVINGCTQNRLPNISNIRFNGLGPDFVPSAISGVACSAGSACGSGGVSQSHVLHAIGLNSVEAASTIRLSLGRMTTKDEITAAANVIAVCINRCRA